MIQGLYFLNKSSLYELGSTQHLPAVEHQNTTDIDCIELTEREEDPEDTKRPYQMAPNSLLT